MEIRRVMVLDLSAKELAILFNLPIFVANSFRL
jgi:hypothetical protein